MMMEQDYPGQVWVGDSGVTCHMTNSEEGLIDWKPIKQRVKMGNGDILEATRVGMMNIKHKEPDTGQEVFFELRGVKLFPGLCKKLFCIKAALREGAVLVSKGESMIVKKGNVNLLFKETTKSGLLSTILQSKLETALVTTETKEDWMVFHQKLGHPCKELTRNIADYFGIKLTGTWTECQECLMANAKKKPEETKFQQIRKEWRKV
jgi:hypothetical protein